MPLKKYFLFGLILLAVLLVGCTKAVVKLDTPIQINYQDSLTINDKLSLKFSNVTEDSRCPEGAQCIWEGRITIVLEVIENGEKTGELSLSNNPRDEMQVQGINEYTITLIDVKPYPKIDNPFNKTDYVATINVSK